MPLGVNLYLFIIVSKEFKAYVNSRVPCAKISYLDKVTLSSTIIELEHTTGCLEIEKGINRQ
jgi:hypothetical protein